MVTNYNPMVGATPYGSQPGATITAPPPVAPVAPAPPGAPIQTATGYQLRLTEAQIAKWAADAANERRQIDDAYINDQRDFGLQQATLNFQERKATFDAKYQMLQYGMDVQQFGASVAEQNRRARSDDLTARMQALQMLADRRGPQDWVAYNNLVNGLSAPDPQSSQQINIFDLVDKARLGEAFTPGPIDTGAGTVEGTLGAGAGNAGTAAPPAGTGPGAPAAPGGTAVSPAAGLQQWMQAKGAAGNGMTSFEQSLAGLPPQALYDQLAGIMPLNELNGIFPGGRPPNAAPVTSAGGTPPGVIPIAAPPPPGNAAPAAPSPSPAPPMDFGTPIAEPASGTLPPAPFGTYDVRALTPDVADPSGGLAAGAYGGFGTPRPAPAYAAGTGGRIMAPKVFYAGDPLIRDIPNPERVTVSDPENNATVNVNRVGMDEMNMAKRHGAMMMATGGTWDDTGEVQSARDIQRYAAAAPAAAAPSVPTRSIPENAPQESPVRIQPIGAPAPYTPTPPAPGGYTTDMGLSEFHRNNPKPRAAAITAPPPSYGPTPTINVNQYSPAQLGSQPFIQKVTGQRSGAVTGFGAPLSNASLGIENFTSMPSLQRINRLLPSEQKQLQGLYEQGLWTDYGDILARARRMAPAGQTTGPTFYGG